VVAEVTLQVMAALLVGLVVVGVFQQVLEHLGKVMLAAQ
jgi:hypothetical protein